MSDRFFVPGVLNAGATIEITGADARKIVTVLRKKTGDRVQVIDSAAHQFPATLHIDNRIVHASLGEPAMAQHLERFAVSVAQAVPKGQKMDFVIEKLTELGITEIFPLYSERTVVEDVRGGKLERWRRVAHTAAQQCGRDTIPAVADPQQLSEIVACFDGFDLVLFPWELSGGGHLRDTLPGLLEGARSVLVVIGPEGGFSSDEADAARAAGAHLVSLGPRILRTETAALVVAAILNYLG